MKVKRFSILFCIPLFTFCQNATEKVSGRYEAIIGATNGPGRVLQLQLGDDHTATLETNHLDEKGAVIRKGSWEKSGKDSLTVYFIDKNGRIALDTLGLSVGNAQLLLKDRGYADDDIVFFRRTR